ncbi:hypothetical protein [Yoonia sp. SS1-5]|uniref:Uncharacterized protein n=1 Tax=Yoonia rhodophyticola TaxID=3137370 RepID=A0AAN0MH49_9RHOB
MVKIADALRMGGGTFLFNLSQAVGRFGEAAALRAFRNGQIDHVFRVGSGTFNMRNMRLGETLQLQNRSGHGLDLITKIVEPRPPAPRWVAIEVKTRMGNDVPFPSLSNKQQDADYLIDRADAAVRGIARARTAVQEGATAGRSWEDMIPHRRTIAEFEAHARSGSVTKIHAKVEVDRQGNQVGEMIMEDW